MATSTNNFDSKEFQSLLNIPNVWDKYFNGMAVYNGKEWVHVSKCTSESMLNQFKTI